MNWRVDLSYEIARKHANAGNLEELQKHDQFLKNKASRTLTKKFTEGMLNFKPTFKYNPNSDVYDTSKKMRVPSWTDRILFKEENCKLRYYNRSESKFSDHRPVLGIFDCITYRTDKDKRQNVLNEVIR